VVGRRDKTVTPGAGVSHLGLQPLSRTLISFWRTDSHYDVRGAGPAISWAVGRRTPCPRTLAAIRATPESAGVKFISENDGGGRGATLLRRTARRAVERMLQPLLEPHWAAEELGGFQSGGGMAGPRKLFVKCWRGAVLLTIYEYGY